MTTMFRKPRAPRLACLALLLAVGLCACDNQHDEKKLGQALASVDGAEITTLQLNEELQRVNVAPAQQDAAGKQLLQALIERQLLQNAAAGDKLERDPKVMRTVERAKASILAQAYLQKRLGNPSTPTRAEVEDYYRSHPEQFSRRKLLGLEQLIFASADFSAQARTMVGNARSIDEVGAWFDAHALRYARTETMRSTAELAPALSARMLDTPKGQLFLLQEGERSMLVAVGAVKDAPVTLALATAQIEQQLLAKRNKEAAQAELTRLRAAARIEILNKSLAPDAGPAQAAPVGAAAAAVAGGGGGQGATAALERGVAGLH